MTRFAVGVDIGGTSIATGLVGDDGQVFAELQVPTHGAGAGRAEATTLALIERVLGHPDAAGRTVVGFSGVSRDKVKTLAGDALADLAKTDELELTYLQLQSMRNFSRIMERGVSAAAKAGETSEATDDAPDARTGAKGKASGRKK